MCRHERDSTYNEKEKEVEKGSKEPEDRQKRKRDPDYTSVILQNLLSQWSRAPPEEFHRVRAESCVHGPLPDKTYLLDRSVAHRLPVDSSKFNFSIVPNADPRKEKLLHSFF